LKAVILAGGEGTRLRPLTLNVPKAMVPVVNQPFLEHVLGYLRRHSVDQAILTLSYLADKVQAHFGDGTGYGLPLCYSVERQPLGTAGAVRAVHGQLDGTTLVLNGDLFTDIDLTRLVAFHRQKKAVATIALVRVEDPTSFGMVETNAEGRVLRFVEKPKREAVTTHYVNGGIYVLEMDALSLVPRDTHYMFENGLFPRLLAEGWPVYALPMEAYWLDLGTPERYLQLHEDLLWGRCSTLWSGPAAPTPFQGGHGRRGLCPGDRIARSHAPLLGNDCLIDPDARVIEPAVLGPGCRVHKGAVVRGGVLWEGVEVGAGARLERCLVGRGCRLGPGVVVSEMAVIGDYQVVPEGSRVAPGERLPLMAAQG